VRRPPAASIPTTSARNDGAVKHDRKPSSNTVTPTHPANISPPAPHQWHSYSIMIS